MGTLLLSIVASISAFAFTQNSAYFLLILVGIYYLLRRKSKAETLASLSMVLIAATGALGKFRGYGDNVDTALLYISTGTASTLVFDLTKRWFGLLPMLGLIGVGVGYLATEKFGPAGYAAGLLLVPVLLREIVNEKKAEVDGK